MFNVFSWNVNGLRAVIRKGALQKFIGKYQPNILCLQEIKAKPEQIEYAFPGYKVFWNPAKKAGYSGTATLVSSANSAALNVINWSSRENYPITGLLDDIEDTPINRPSLNFHTSGTDIAASEGRVLTIEFKKFYLVNVYTPNSKPDLSRLSLRKTEWDPEFLNYLNELEETKPVVVCGDFNAAHKEIDIARPKTNHHSAGFTDEERQGITNLVNAGLIDTFRSLHPNEVRYTWWSHWGNARANNVGWRIDYFFVSESLRPNLKTAEIYETTEGSDHCPISIGLEF